VEGRGNGEGSEGQWRTESHEEISNPTQQQATQQQATQQQATQQHKQGQATQLFYHGRVQLEMKSWWFIFFFWRSFFEIRNVMSFPTDTVRRALENKKLLDRAKNSNYSIVYSWFSSSHSKSNLKVIDIHREQQQLEASVSSFRNHYSDIPIHLFTNLQNFSSNSMVIHRIDLPSPTSLEMTHSLLYG
jgi:hypothetical protein